MWCVLGFGIINRKTYWRIRVAVQWNDFKIFFAFSSSFQYIKILLGKLWQPWKVLEFSNTSALASYKLVRKKKKKSVSYVSFSK